MNRWRPEDEVVALRKQLQDAERRLEVENGNLRKRLVAAHRELARRHRRDLELAQQMPAIAARMQSLAADAALDLRSPAEPPRENWAKDPEIDWTGIDGGHP